MGKPILLFVFFNKIQDLRIIFRYSAYDRVHAKHRVSKNQYECKPMKPTGQMRKAAVGESVKYRKQVDASACGGSFCYFHSPNTNVKPGIAQPMQ